MRRFPTARSSSREEKPLSALRARIHEIIFEADTPVGKSFDVILLVAIVLSVLVAMLETVSVIHARYGPLLYGIEWFFTILFTIEYHSCPK
jgi:voltage-gated potassium channel